MPTEKEGKMRNYFGTDGIRGVAGEELTARTAFALGNALCRLKSRPLVVLGRDTRTSSDMLSLALEAGVCAGGGCVRDGGVLPTAAVAFFVRRTGADFGVVVSASHNPPEFNGLKVFDFRGCKLSEEEEEYAERFFDEYSFASALRCGRCYPLARRGAYADFLVSCCERPLAGKKFVLDCANGAAGEIAPRVFARLGAEVFVIGRSRSGRKVNMGCGALHPEKMCEAVVERGADAGFCYDGDADRLIAADERGNIVDGDKMLCILAKDLQAKGRLPHSLAVGTAHTNTGAERELQRCGISLYRTDVGDKYVAEYMRRSGAAVGGEQSGHIILAEYATTGDGILTSLKAAQLLAGGARFSELADIRLFPQYNLSVRVKDKVRVLGNEEVRSAIEKAGHGVFRLVVRASGTEPVVRIFAEAEDLSAARDAAERVRDAILRSEE